jgi:hypothetical protein
MMRMPLSCLCSILLSTLACGATNGGAVHPEAGKPNQAEYCADAPAEEQNCMACASKAGCGYCESPKPGAPVCQPGTSDNPDSSGCNGALIISNEDCAGPPPAPPQEGY